MSAQGLLSSVFSCSPSSKAVSKRRLRQTRSLDPALMRHHSTDADETSTPVKVSDLKGLCVGQISAAGAFSGSRNHPKLRESQSLLDARLAAEVYQSASSKLAGDTSGCPVYYDDNGSKSTKRNAGWDSPFRARSPVSSTGSGNTIFSPRKWLHKRSSQPSSTKSHATWTSEGDFTWNSMSGCSVGLRPVPLQGLSELERLRLQEVALSRLLQDCDLACTITIPKDGQKRKKSFRRKLDVLSKEKSKDKECLPQAFGIPLSQVISNDRAHKQRHEPQREGQRRDPSDSMSSFPHRSPASKRSNNKELSSSNSSLSSTCETPNGSPLPNTPEVAPRTRRRGGVSVDCITDLDDDQSRLLEALQLSLPAETPSNRKKHCDKKLSLNPIYKQVPRAVDSCCRHLEKYGLQTVGIFRVGSSKKRVRQLREEFDQGLDVQLDEEEHSVHDVAALLKEFLRDMPDPLLTRELYTAFINTMLLDGSEQESSLQLLIYLLPPCNSDTLLRLLHFLSTVAAHAEDGLDKDGQEITGNKMTSVNLATIFGPNLLHKQKNSDKEFTVQSFARAEESSAIISVVQRMIHTYDTLFMVPADLQNEVLISLLETDPDVVDYLLRRKASQSSSPDPLRTVGSFSLSDRRFSSDSNKASSGEVSPYDNNSPVLSERLLPCHPGDSSSLSGLSFKGPGEHPHSGHAHHRNTCPTPPPTGKEPPDDCFWGSWQTLLTKHFPGHHNNGSHGDVSECESYGSSEGVNSHQSNGKPRLRRTQTSLGVPMCRPHPPVTRCNSSPRDHRGQRQADPLSHQQTHSQSEAISSEDLAGRMGHPDSPSSTPKGKPVGRSGAWSHYHDHVRGLHISHSFPSLSIHQPGGPSPHVSQQPRQSSSLAPQTMAPGPGEGQVLGSPELQRERWQIWQLLSTDNTDTLLETLV